MMNRWRQWLGRPAHRTPRAVSVEPREGYTLWITFDDGTAGLLDMTKDVRRKQERIKPLRDLDVFRRAQIGNDEEDGLLWPDVYDEPLYGDPANTYFGAWDHDGLYYRVIVSGDCTKTDRSVTIDEVQDRIRQSMNHTETRASEKGLASEAAVGA